MAIVFECPRCDRKYSLAETMAGRRVTCKACGQEFGVPSATSNTSSWDDDNIPIAPVKSKPKPAPTYDDELFTAEPPARNPARIRPRRERVVKKLYRGDDDARLSPFVVAFLGIIGGLVIIPLLIIAGNDVANGNSKGAIAGMWLIMMICLALMMVVYSLKILAVAIAEKGLLIGVACMFIPFLTLIFVVMHWERTKSLVAGYLIAWSGLFISAVLILPNQPQALAQQNAGPNGGGGGGFGLPQRGQGVAGVNDEPMWQIAEGVVIDATNLDDDAARELFAEKLAAVAKRNANRTGVSSFGGPRAGVIRFQVEPVSDPKPFSDFLSDFATVNRVNGRKIEVTAKLAPDELAQRRERVALRKKKDAEQQAERQKQHENSIAEAEKHRKDEEIANTPPPLEMKVDPNAGPIDKALVDTRTADGFKAREALKRLSWGIPEARKSEVVKAVAPMLSVKDFFTAKEAVQTLSALKSSEAVPALIGVLERRDIEGDVVIALGEIGDVSAAKALADRLEKCWPNANKALIAIGAPAEAAVLEKLTDRNARVRTLALEVLAEIGGTETLKTMKAMRPDPDFGTKLQAVRTMETIVARTKGR